MSELVRFGEFWRVQKQYPGKPGKADPSSDPREPDVTNKFPILMLEGTPGAIDVKTDSSPYHRHCTCPWSAPALEEGGRAVFAMVPYWLVEFGPYPERNVDGSRNLLRIMKMCPGGATRGGCGKSHSASFCSGTDCGSS